MTTAVYIGARMDTCPLVVLKHVKNFIYIDSLPASEYGTFGFNKKGFYHDDFIDGLYKVMNNLAFDCTKKTKNLYIFKNAERNVYVYYYTSTPFPEGITPAMRAKISKAQILIVAGFDPHKSILDMIQLPFTLVAFNGTCYTYSDEELQVDYSTDDEDENPRINLCYYLPTLSNHQIKQVIYYNGKNKKRFEDCYNYDDKFIETIYNDTHKFIDSLKEDPDSSSSSDFDEVSETVHVTSGFIQDSLHKLDDKLKNQR